MADVEAGKACEIPGTSAREGGAAMGPRRSENPLLEEEDEEGTGVPVSASPKIAPHVKNREWGSYAESTR